MARLNFGVGVIAGSMVGEGAREGVGEGIGTGVAGWDGVACVSVPAQPDTLINSIQARKNRILRIVFVDMLCLSTKCQLLISFPQDQFSTFLLNFNPRPVCNDQTNMPRDTCRQRDALSKHIPNPLKSDLENPSVIGGGFSQKVFEGYNGGVIRLIRDGADAKQWSPVDFARMGNGGGLHVCT